MTVSRDTGFMAMATRELYPGFISFTDDGGRYSYEKQPEICHWNLMKLGEALHPVISKEKLHPLLPKYWEEYDEYYLNKMRKKV